MTTASRTVNPLHFEDLEPHRFEDMVRQLVYDWRAWVSIEAVGRLGSDEGIDIRATERVTSDRVQLGVVDDEIDEDEQPMQEVSDQRVWIIQCKRERQIGPSDIKRIVQNDLSQQDIPPYGYIITAACDFSKKARDAFRQAVVSFGVEEFYMWGKAELEDMLFRPQNDHLLFAYFGISLQVRRRSIKTAVRANITLKRQLVKVLGAIRDYPSRPKIHVLIRDPRDAEYPFIEGSGIEEFINNPPWRYWRFYGFHPQDGLEFVKHEYLAFVNWETDEWDALFDCDRGWSSQAELHGVPSDLWRKLNEQKRERVSKWSGNIPKENHGALLEIAMVPFERIIAIDDLGDSVNAGPHLLVEYRENGNPFDHDTYSFLRNTDLRYDDEMMPDAAKRISHFVGEPLQIEDE